MFPRFFSLMSALDDAVTSAVGAAGPLPDFKEDENAIVVQKEAPAEEKKEEKKADTPAEDAPDDLGLSKDDVVEARRLFAALRDPEKATTVISFLAEQAGFVKAPETKKEAVEQRKGIVDELKEALGPELEYIADKMGPVIQKHMEEQIKESSKPITARLEAAEEEKLVTVFNQAQDDVGKKYFQDGKIPEPLMKQMNTLLSSGAMNATKGQKMDDFLEDVLIVAARKSKTELKEIARSTTNGRTERNRNDAAGRLASDGSGGKSPQPGEKAGNLRQQMTLDDAVKAALEASRSIAS